MSTQSERNLDREFNAALERADMAREAVSLHLLNQNRRALAHMPLEHQLRASVALQRRKELQAAQMSASIDGRHGRTVELEAAIELMELELESLGVVLS